MRTSRGFFTFLSIAVLLPVSCGTFPRIDAASAATAPERSEEAATETIGTSFADWQVQHPELDPWAVAQRLRGAHTGLLPSEIDHVAKVLVDECRRVDLSPDLVLALIYVESSGNNFARSHVGALGLMQLRPSTAKAVARRVGLEWRGKETLFDSSANVRLGIQYLDELVQRFDSVPTALAAYNWGPTRISQMLRKGETLPVVYPNKILHAFHQRFGI